MPDVIDALYVSTRGNDAWSGTLPEPNADNTDGPLYSLTGARDAVRRLQAAGLLAAAATVWVRGGRYPLAAPVFFTPEDTAPVTYAAYPDEQPIFDGGVRLTGWQPTTINGVAAWVTDAPPFAFRQLFVNGARRVRPRLPKGREEYRITAVDIDLTNVGLFDGVDRFQVRPGDIDPNWRNLTDVEIIAPHFWCEERLPIESVDTETHTVVCQRKMLFNPREDFLPDLATYYVENVFEALTEPGEWYLDRSAGKVYYIPCAGETLENTEIYAARLLQFVRFEGQRDDPVRFITLRGLTFEHGGWVQPYGYGQRMNPYGPWRPDPLMMETSIAAPGEKDYATAAQAAYNVPGVLYLEWAHNIAIEDCRIAHCGWYGIELAEGCRGNRISGNTLTDLGAGGIKICGASAYGLEADRTGNTQISDNHIYDIGHVFHAGIGVVLMHSYGNRVAHNHIHDGYYSGISSGWVWGYAPSVSRDNIIEYNHIHDLGKRLLSDMGGIYMLSVQPGTCIRGNLIHDVQARTYGGWGIYLDEGSSHMIVEHNATYNTGHEGFNQHYGRENIIRHNIFALAGAGTVSLGRAEGHNAFTFERNILLTNGNALFTAGGRAALNTRPFMSDINLFWDLSGADFFCYDGRFRDQVYTLAEYQAIGNDRFSIVADPGCRPPLFELPADSPAQRIAFPPFDWSQAGVRKRR